MIRNIILFLLLSQPIYLTAQTQIGGLILGENASSLAGNKVKISADGSRIAVAAPSNDDIGTGAGQVRVHELVDGEWLQIGQDIDGDNANDDFGSSIAFTPDGQTLIVGAAQWLFFGSDQGYAKVFTYDPGNDLWVQVGSTITDSVMDTQFGGSVAISADGTKIVVAARTGLHAKTYELINGDWVLVNTLTDNFSDGTFNINMTPNGNYLVAGIGRNSVNDTIDLGFVNIYNFQNNEWNQIGQTIMEEVEGDWFGASTDITDDGQKVIIGAYGNDESGVDAGYVQVYELVGGSWTQIGGNVLGEAADDAFGSDVAISGDGNYISVGGRLNDDGGFNTGHVRNYSMNSENTWTQIGEDIDGIAAGNRFGNSVDLSYDGNFLVIGSPFNNNENGQFAGYSVVYSICQNTTNISVTACDSYTSPSGNYTVTNSGMYTDTLINSAGCDSILWIDLTVNNSDTINISGAGCEQFVFGQIAYTVSGFYILDFTNSVGCDSIVILDVDIYQPDTIALVESACSSYVLNDSIYSESGVYSQLLSNLNGCDSLITLDLTILEVDTSISNEGSTLSANQANANYQWIDCLTMQEIQNATSPEFTPTVSGNYAVLIDNGVCETLSACEEVIVLSANDLIYDKQISVFPNPVPSNTLLNIDLGETIDFIEVEISDAKGAILFKNNFNHQQNIVLDPGLDIKGLYLVNIKTPKFKITRKVLWN